MDQAFLLVTNTLSYVCIRFYSTIHQLMDICVVSNLAIVNNAASTLHIPVFMWTDLLAFMKIGSVSISRVHRRVNIAGRHCYLRKACLRGDLWFVSGNLDFWSVPVIS